MPRCVQAVKSVWRNASFSHGKDTDIVHTHSTFAFSGVNNTPVVHIPLYAQPHGCAQQLRGYLPLLKNCLYPVSTAPITITVI